ncbi:phosphoribosylformylglycinamidine cyclo-ligase [Nanchangia anserum]|uniref:phosphoribosylformylglycinamidine cyclo-ligase n=1 Tax=Nanchangia anserum TaxID=2692125 RepID=UPI001CC6879E|nr:phosphoribosylformylglycinamidine cyclo-ligase [Nanchangia anserum]
MFGEGEAVVGGGGVTYAQAGVDIEAGDRAVDLMKAAVAATYSDRVVTDSGAFAGMVDASALAGMRRPLLATSTDGVGTKVAIAQALDIHDTIGQDLVGMVVDDIVVTGARPLLMTDYIACGHVVPERIADIVRGVAEACAAIDTPLLGGETAEHPGLMGPDDYDIAGAATGVVDADRVLGADRVREGDAVVAMASSGLHSNGFSLVRAIIAEAGWDLERHVDEFARTLGEELLEPTRLYTKVCLEQLDAVGPEGLHALSHITGGGLGANVSRVLPKGLTALIDRSTWQVPPVFALMQRLGDVPAWDLEQTLNMGVGMVALVAPDAVDRVCMIAREAGIDAWELGRVVRSDADPALPEARVVEGAKGADGGRALLHSTYRFAAS